ncbi:MAG: ABC transporter ATP-binding protein [Bacteroidota bacterium]
MLEVKQISKSFPGFSMKEVSFSVEKGDYFVMLGASGTGKSLLLEIISGMIKPDSGSVWLNNNDITHTKIQKRNISLVFQDQVLFPHFSIFNNIAFSLRNRKLKKNDITSNVEELSVLLEIKHLLNRKPGTLSGGEAQRVALARALAMQPECLLLDEPLSNIDTQLRHEMRYLLRKINGKGQTIIHVTHDYEEAISLAKNIAVLENGSIAQAGKPEEVFMYPKSEFVAKFTGIKNFYKGQLTNTTNDEVKIFETLGIKINVMTEEQIGPGFLLIPAESISISNDIPEGSPRNVFKGKVIDVFPARIGMEVAVDVGIKMLSLVSRNAAEQLSLKKDKEIWISFKASSLKFFPL